MSIRLRSALALAAAGLMLSVHATPAASLPLPSLDLYAAGRVDDPPLLLSGTPPPVQQQAATGPLLANVVTGLNLGYPASSNHDHAALFYARGLGRVDYGNLDATVDLNSAATDGGFQSGNFSGVRLDTSMSVQSGWTDTFVIEGGTGVGVATVSVALRGRAENRYGANGTVPYDEPALETFGAGGYAPFGYSVRIFYDVPPPGYDPENDSRPIFFDTIFSSASPVVVDDILTGSILFEYGVPFALSSSLSMAGYDQIYVDFDQTETLSMFGLPAGASLTSGSGHIYTVPEPSTALLLVSGSVLTSALAIRRSHRTV